MSTHPVQATHMAIPTDEELQAERADLETLMRHPGYKRLEYALEQQIHNGLLPGAMNATDSFTQTKFLGTVSGVKLALSMARAKVQAINAHFAQKERK